MSLVEGTIIDDVWVIERSLGAGGMGSVYRARNRHAAKIKAAIKMLSPSLVHHPEAKTRFVREAEILYGLDHPHIVKVRNIRLEHNPPYIEMEFIEGRSLYEVLCQPPFPFDRALLFAEQLASAVRYLHRHNVFHRDIKPANLLIRKGTVLKLVDFGLAVDVEGSERITQDGAHFGTVAYAPPEWIRPQDVDPKLWDLYAVGVIIYEMLTGGTPFVADEGASPRQAAVQIMAQKQQLEHLDPGPAYPEALRSLVRDLTAKAPGQRIRDAKLVLKRLQRIQEEMSFNANTVLATGLSGDELRRAVKARALDITHDSSEHAAPPRPLAGRPSKPPPTPSLTSVPPRKVLQFVTAGFVGLGLIFFFAALTVGVITTWRQVTQPQPRDVELLLAGVPRDAELALHVDGAPPDERDGLRVRFRGLLPGEHEVRWTAGPGCAEAPCPETGCPEHCASGSSTLVVEAGDEVWQTPIELSLPEPRSVRVRLAPGAPQRVTVLLGDQRIDAADGTASFDVLPGSYQVEARAGSCDDAEAGCSANGDCPPGCSSLVVPLVVPATGDVLLPPIALPPPAAAAPRPSPAPATAPAPRPSAPGSSSPITRGAYASWVASHPDWAPDAARAAGRADGSYLRGSDLGAGGSQPMVSVPWAAASAFCASRGGLAQVGASPTTWDEGATGLFQEWRTDGGAPAWRRYDGATSQQLSRSEANAFTGFRCAR
jgi:serine/threonine protein kinase